MLAVPFSVLNASFSSAKSSLQFCLPGFEDQDCVWTFVLLVIWKTLLIPYLLLPSFTGCSLSPSHAFYLTILVAPFGSTGNWGQCLRLCSNCDILVWVVFPNYPGFCLPRPSQSTGLPGGHLPPLCSHTISQGQLGFLPTEWGEVGAFLSEKGFPHQLIIWGFISIFVE